jgi:hypothetical protein
MRLRGTRSEHAEAFDTYAARAEHSIKLANKDAKEGGGCHRLFAAVSQISAESAIANHEARYAFVEDPYALERAEARIDKISRRLIKLDDQLRERCLKP